MVEKPGLEFPLARIAAVFSLACGAVLDVGICRHAGTGQSELGMLRALWNLFRPGDVLLADRLMCTGTEMGLLKQRGVDRVCHLMSHRNADFRRAQRLYEAGNPCISRFKAYNHRNKSSDDLLKGNPAVPEGLLEE